MRERISIHKIVVYFIGAVLIIGNSYALLTGYLLPKRDPWVISQIRVIVESQIYNLSLFPTGLPEILASIFGSKSVNTVYAIIGFWQFVVLLCGIFLLRFNNIFRRFFVVLCSTRIVFFLLSIPIVSSLYKQTEGKEFVFNFYHLISLLIPVFYIIIFLRPKIKNLFNSNELSKTT